MRLSDLIEAFLKDLLTEEDIIEIRRNELAEKFNCVPSQINYVIATRFNPDQGYYVESKRGGGGNIRIKKVNITKSEYFMHIINNIGDKVSMNEVSIFLNNFLMYEFISEEQAKIIKIVTNDNVLNVPPQYKDSLRANILKNVLVNLI